MRSRRCLLYPKIRVLALATAVSCTSAVTAVDAQAAASIVPPGATKLSDETRRTQWAHAIALGGIRTKPTSASKTITRLRLRTELGGAETYLLLNSWTDDKAVEWIRIRIPRRPNGGIGWVRRDALGDFRTTNVSVVVNRRKLRIQVRRAGKIVLTAPIGIGKVGTPTPSGRFWIRDRFKADGGLYGARALGTAAYAPYLTDWPLGGIIGIHGTNQPELIPGRPSHGCIRMRNAAIIRMYRIVKIGTPLWIR